MAFLAVAIGAHRSAAAHTPDLPPGNPLQLPAALQMAALFQAVLMAVYVARERWGASGVFTSAAVLGLTDVDALTVSMAKDVAYALSPTTAAMAIGIGILSNTAMKIILALFLGGKRFRIIAATTLLLMLAALALALGVQML